jgi:hypothetical protein
MEKLLAVRSTSGYASEVVAGMGCVRGLCVQLERLG